MNFEFSDEQKQMGVEARRFLAAKCPTTAVRTVLEGDQAYDKALWAGLAEMGFLGVQIPEAYGGLGLGYLELCVIAEEMGRALAPVPFSSSVFLATEFLLLAGCEAQKAAWLPRLAAGEAIGTFAHAERAGAVTPKMIQTSAAEGRLSGVKTAVPDGGIADFAIVSARTAGGSIGLYLVDLNQPGVTRTTLETIDPSRGHVSLELAGATAELLGDPAEGWSILEQVFDRAAILTAFEQIGGADRALEIARDYALERMAFGRPIGSFQAIKHKLADMLVDLEHARSTAYHAVWALSNASDDPALAASIAQATASAAFSRIAADTIQVLGGIGFTWEHQAHLYFKRAATDAALLGTPEEHRSRVADMVLDTAVADADAARIATGFPA